MIGVYGGTFDPVHYGHLRTALEVSEIFELDELRLIPAMQPPHRVQPAATPQQRLDMLHTAVAEQSGFIVDDREMRRTGPSYMVDTLASLRAEIGTIPLLLFVGADAFSGMEHWHRWQTLFDYAHIVVMTRPGFAPGALPPFYAERLILERQQLRNCSAGHLFMQSVTQLEVSATQIRNLIAEHRNPRFLLPDSVLAFIHTHHLYQNH